MISVSASAICALIESHSAPNYRSANEVMMRGECWLCSADYSLTNRTMISFASIDPCRT